MKQWTKAEALPIMRQAWNEKRLAAQNGALRCAYRSALGPCIIGVLIDDDTAAAWDNHRAGSVALREHAPRERDDLVSVRADMKAMFYASGDGEFFQQAQRLHDAACVTPGARQSSQLERLREFLFAA